MFEIYNNLIKLPVSFYNLIMTVYMYIFSAYILTTSDEITKSSSNCFVNLHPKSRVHRTNQNALFIANTSKHLRDVWDTKRHPFRPHGDRSITSNHKATSQSHTHNIYSTYPISMCVFNVQRGYVVFENAVYLHQYVSSSVQLSLLLVSLSLTLCRLHTNVMLCLYQKRAFAKFEYYQTNIFALCVCVVVWCDACVLFRVGLWW